MAVAKKYNSTTQQWEPLLAGGQGIAGPTGPSGVVSVQAPLVNSGTSSNAILGVQTNPVFGGNLSATNVGVGTTTPVINSNGNSIQVHAPAGESAAIHFTTGSTGSAAADGMIVGRWSDGNNYVYTYEPEPIVIATSGLQSIKVNPDGQINQPRQPVFTAMRRAGTLANTSTPTTIVFDSVYVNVGNNYNTSNGRFTAPISGIYRFDTRVQKRSGGGLTLWWYKNGAVFDRAVYNDLSGDSPQPGSFIYMSLSAGDYVTVVYTHTGAGDIYAGSEYFTVFTGHMVA